MRSCLKGKIFHLVGALVRSVTVWIAIDPCPFVFVCDFDPLGVNLTLYDLRTVCLQTGEPVADGRRIVMLNARGPLDDVPEPLAAFLRLVAGEDVKGDSFCDRVKAIIERKIADPEWM